MSDGASPRPSSRKATALSVVLLAALLAQGCAGLFGTGGGEVGVDDRFRRAESALEAGRFVSASRDLRSLASRCESGARGREAVLMLAALELDVRNPRAFPLAASQLAARYLQMPSVPASSRALAETLYLLALDLGSPPVEDPFGPVPRRTADSAEAEGGRIEGRSSGDWAVADRFEDCALESREAERRRLPERPGPTLWQAMETLTGEQDAFSVRADSLSARIRSLATDAARSERLQAQTDSLEAELERIRSLLRRGLGPTGDRADSVPPPDTGRPPGDDPVGGPPAGQSPDLP